MTYGKLLEYQCRTMQWLHDTRASYEFLILIDSDVMLIKPGFAEFLDSTMRDCEYMGTRFHEIHPNCGWDIGRRFRYKWDHGWRTIMETDVPYGVFNPGQIFRRDCVEKILSWTQLPAARMRATKSRLNALEEIILPTAVVRLGCRPKANPGGAAIQLSRHTLHALMAFHRSPGTFLVHKVGMSLGAPDRQLINLLAAGKDAEQLVTSRSFPELNTPGTDWQQTARRILADVYYRLVPELPGLFPPERQKKTGEGV